MALIKCFECGREISDKSKVCVHCGCPVEDATIESFKTNEEMPSGAASGENTEKTVEQKKVNKLAIIAACVVVGIAIIALLLFFLVFKPGYSEAAALYTDAVAEYEDKWTKIATDNQELTAAIETLQAVLSSDEKPYDPDAITVANTALSEGKNALVDLSKWENKNIKPVKDYSVFQADAMKKAAEEINNISVELTGVIQSIQAANYSAIISKMSDATQALEASIEKMKQVTAPSEAFVWERLTNICTQAGIVDMVAITKETDLGNSLGTPGGYTAKIVFQHKNVNIPKLNNGEASLYEVGNPAGGCVEVFKTVEDAQRRSDQLKMETNGREQSVICGTMLIRASNGLNASAQHKLLSLISDEMLRVGPSDKPIDNITENDAVEQPEKTDPPTTETLTENVTGHVHSYSPATCTSPATCSCGATNGTKLDHDYQADGIETCLNPAKCSRCGQATTLLLHDFTEGSCTEPQTCKVCGTTIGTATGHSYNSVSDDCTICGEPSPEKAEALSKCSLELPTLPKTICLDWGATNADGIPDSSCIVTDISYKFSYTGKDKIALAVYFSGTNTSVEGDIGGDTCMIGWKLYNSDNAVVKSGTFYSPKILVNESFAAQCEMVIASGGTPDNYRLELVDVH